MGWKYVVAELATPNGTVWEFPVIFPDKLVHKDVAQVLNYLPPFNGLLELGPPRRKLINIVAAGMIDGMQAHNVHGESETLQIKSRLFIDRKLINNYQYAHGVR